MTPKQLEMLKHAWGFDHPRRPGYRSRYCGGTFDENILALTAAGMFTGPRYEGNFGEGHAMFFITEKGLEFLFDLKVKQLNSELAKNGKTKKWLTRKVNIIKEAMAEDAW